MARAQEYAWNSGAQKHGLGRCDPAKVARFFKQLAAEDRLTKEVVRTEAEKPRNPLHGGTGWLWGDDQAAAERWRHQIASSAISGLREITIVRTDAGEERAEIPAFVQSGKLSHRGLGDFHRPIDEVMDDALDRAEYLTRLLREMRSIERTYAILIARYPLIGERWSALRRAIEVELPPAE